MKKIIISVLAIVLTMGAVTGTAYALFSDTATIQGVTINSGNAALRFDVAPTLPAVDGGPTLNLSGFPLSGLYPGFSQSGALWLMNLSQSNIALRVTGKLTSAATWDPTLANAIWVNVVDRNGYGVGPGYVVTGSTTAHETGWQSLTTWNTTDIAFPSIIPRTMPSGHYGYDVYVKVDPSADNTIANKTLGGVVFTLTGTQVP